MALNFGLKNIFPHGREFNQGVGNVRVGAGALIVAQDGSGDFDSIQEALDSISGGTIFVKEGTYTLTSTLTLGANDILVGAGFGTKIITTSDITMITASGVRSGIYNLRLVGNSTGSSQVGINVSGNEVIIRDCWILNMGNDSIIHSGNNGLITGCFIQDAEGRCIDASGDYLKISDNYIDDATDSGILMTGCLGSQIIGNQILNHGEAGVELISSTQVSIVGNYIFSNGDNNTNGDGIEVRNGSNDCCISGNSSHTNDGYGIDVQAGANNTIIIGNSILNNEDGAVLDNGTTTHPNGVVGDNTLSINDLNAT